jgi:hypothetical protein
MNNIKLSWRSILFDISIMTLLLYGIFFYTHSFISRTFLNTEYGIYTTWYQTIFIDVIFLALLVFFGWRLWTQTKITFTSNGVFQPNLTDTTFIPWSEIQRVEFMKKNINIVSETKEIMIILRFFKDKSEIAATIRQYAPSSALIADE